MCNACFLSTINYFPAVRCNKRLTATFIPYFNVSDQLRVLDFRILPPVPFPAVENLREHLYYIHREHLFYPPRTLILPGNQIRRPSRCALGTSKHWFPQCSKSRIHLRFIKIITYNVLEPYFKVITMQQDEIQCTCGDVSIQAYTAYN